MTDYQFQQYEKVRNECDALKKELDMLKGQNFKPGETGMTDFQFNVYRKAVYQRIKAYVDGGKSPEEILAAFEDLLGND